MKNLGKNIRLLRHQKSWSQEEAARQLAISIPAFSKIETGVTDINLSRLEQIAKLFELPVTELLSIGTARSDADSETLVKLNIKVRNRELELADLQKKVIELYEELRQVKVTI
ncbi:Helix-turn-helix domain-containing protein [Mucilaginibacter gossypiicola]|uniref:Helix-turn-helix domain-containing protein n=1 Tax=Mucilaginibacter gossypiicola TaxID=551995 RepID=A0A1H8KTL9_9SPHI|nr:helix-turn-helix transcriptional regulator [Mucilaginibacter gossypiicola]SEN96227.1 Helix-turn-helix domain-containing protein [Mucilaginibacter gossypiicola]